MGQMVSGVNPPQFFQGGRARRHDGQRRLPGPLVQHPVDVFQTIRRFGMALGRTMVQVPRIADNTGLATVSPWSFEPVADSAMGTTSTGQGAWRSTHSVVEPMSSLPRTLRGWAPTMISVDSRSVMPSTRASPGAPGTSRIPASASWGSCAASLWRHRPMRRSWALIKGPSMGAAVSVSGGGGHGVNQVETGPEGACQVQGNGHGGFGPGLQLTPHQDGFGRPCLDWRRIIFPAVAGTNDHQRDIEPAGEVFNHCSQKEALDP